MGQIMPRPWRPISSTPRDHCEQHDLAAAAGTHALPVQHPGPHSHWSQHAAAAAALAAARGAALAPAAAVAACPLRCGRTTERDDVIMINAANMMILLYIAISVLERLASVRPCAECDSHASAREPHEIECWPFCPVAERTRHAAGARSSARRSGSAVPRPTASRGADPGRNRKSHAMTLEEGPQPPPTTATSRRHRSTVSRPSTAPMR